MVKPSDFIRVNSDINGNSRLEFDKSKRGDSMKIYKIEMILELNEEQSLEWVFQAIRDLLEDGEAIQSGRSLEIETESV